jgi:hydroxyethylthiazole kinase-like uncharacterized protein yjeF
MITLDRDWTEGNPLRKPDAATDKNSRGRVLAVGGSATVPAGLLLTGEAAFRAGAGKVQLATVASAALAIGVRFPEAAVYPLEQNAGGELGEGCVAEVLRLFDRSDALILGPGTGSGSDAAAILAGVAGSGADKPLLIDAAMLHVLPDREAQVAAFAGARVLTPHPGEMATLMDCDEDDVCAELAEAAAARFAATVVLKSGETWIATPAAETLHYAGGGPGLGTGGSGDVLAGIIGGLLARGVAPQAAAAWGVWAHGEAGRQLARDIAPLGFLARELLPLVPGLLRGG